ncbi:MAG: DnaJ domain-containing protein [Candidatus Sericytochromatia bacterium]
MSGKNNYLKILFEITNKASQTYVKYQEYKINPDLFHDKEPHLYLTFQIIDKLVTGAKEKIEGSSNKDYSINQKTYISLREEYYSILECKVTDSNDIIKGNYRKLVKDFHPDTISGKDLPKPFIEFANNKFKEIQTAYEYIKKERNF